MNDRAAFRRGLMMAVAAAVAIYVALAVYSDYRTLANTLSRFPWKIFPLILLLTVGNYTGRFIKWRWYLHLVNAGVGWRDAARIFGVAMTMVLTPGKSGELVKAYMVKNVSGTPMRVTTPIVLAERMTDGLAMLLLASVGLYSFHNRLTELPLLSMALSILAFMAVVVVFVQVRPLALWVLKTGERVPALSTRVGGLRDFYESSYLLLRPQNLLVAVLIGTISWSFEGLAYFIVLHGVGATADMSTALSAVFIFSISSILGAVVATPGGLGGTELGLSALPQKLVGLTKNQAVAAAILVRFATLWFGVGLGLICFARWPHLLEGPEPEGTLEGSAVDPAATDRPDASGEPSSPPARKGRTSA